MSLQDWVLLITYVALGVSLIVVGFSNLPRKSTLSTIYLVGRDSRDFGGKWEVMGLYTNKEVAIFKCTGPDWFVMPLEKDTPFPEEAIELGERPWCHSLEE